MLALAVFVTGRGSNLKAILDSPILKNVVEVKAVVGDKLYYPAFDIAKNFSIPVYSVGKKEGFSSFDDLYAILKGLKVEQIVLAGFLKMIPENFVKSFRNKIINIHPALLPSFAGLRSLPRVAESTVAFAPSAGAAWCRVFYIFWSAVR